MKIGERLDITGFAIKGPCDKMDAEILVDKIVKTLGMHKAHVQMCYDYPVKGAGGKGYTYLQPITESFIAFDAWPDFGGAYLIICSCKTTNLNRVTKKIRACGYKIKKLCANELRLCNGFQG